MLRRSPLKRKTPLKAYRGLNQVSPKHLEELRAELPIRLELIRRCGGSPVYREFSVVVNGERATVQTVLCWGGICELCGKPAKGEFLEPHEKRHRSLMGKMSLENSIMIHRLCHIEEQNKCRDDY